MTDFSRVYHALTCLAPSYVLQNTRRVLKHLPPTAEYVPGGHKIGREGGNITSPRVGRRGIFKRSSRNSRALYERSSEPSLYVWRSRSPLRIRGWDLHIHVSARTSLPLFIVCAVSIVGCRYTPRVYRTTAEHGGEYRINKVLRAQRRAGRRRELPAD